MDAGQRPLLRPIWSYFRPLPLQKRKRVLNYLRGHLQLQQPPSKSINELESFGGTEAAQSNTTNILSVSSG